MNSSDLKTLEKKIEKLEKREQALLTHEERLKSQYNRIPSPLFTWQKIKNDFVLLECNDAAQKMTHGSAADFIGQKAAEMYRDKPEIIKDLSRCFEEKIPLEREMLYQFKSTGEVKHLLAKYAFAPPDLIIVQTDDITELKQAEETLKRENSMRHLLLENLPCIALILKKGTREIVYSNEMARKIGAVPGTTCYETCALRDAPCPFCLAPEVWSTNNPRRLEKILHEGKYYEGRWVPLSDDLYIHYIFDITERIQTKDDLKESEEKFRTFMEKATELMYITDEKLNLTYVNEAMAKTLGYSREELLKMNVTHFLTQNEIKEGLKPRYEELVTTGRLIIEDTWLTKDGREIRGEISAVAVYDNNNFKGARAIFHDITGRKKAEEVLKNANEKLAATLKALPDLMFEVDASGIIYDFVAPHPERLFVPPEKFLGKAMHEVLPKTPAEIIERAIIDADKNGSHHGATYSLEMPAGLHWFELSIASKGDIESKDKRFILLVHDITKRKRAEEALKMSEQRYGSIVENLNDALYIFDFTGHILDVNEIACRMLGYSREELIGAHLSMIDSPGDVQLIPRHMQDLHDKGTVVFDLEHVRKDGSLVPINASAKIVSRDGNGIIQSFVRDITERKQAEDALRKSEKNLSEAQRIAHLGSFEYNFQANSLLWSDEIFRIFGISPEKFSGKIEDFLNIIHPNDREQVRRLREESLLKGGKGNFEHRIIRPDGSIRIVHERYETFFAEDGRPLYRTGTVQDITDQKKIEEEKKNLEEQLFQSQKMESIGRLAGGVAHDFNNILTGIMGYAELLQMQFGNKSTREGQAVDVIIRGAERAADLTRQLLGFARGGKYNPVPLKINEVIKECIKVSENIFEKNITVKYQLLENIDTLEADKNQMHQVLTNIIINARDAMPDGGEILISTENVFIDREYVSNHPEFKMEQYVKISISDTGIGMPKAVKERIFEPFYTTKGRGKGTGLGLATVYGIIKNHNGHIHVYSEPGIGTTFTIYLPVSEKEIIKERREQKAIKGDATVLIVDDEENIRIMAQKQLESLGYKVLVAGDGNEAITILKENSDKIDLVLLDIIMPNLGGKETYRKLKQINPELKVVIISGFSQNGKASELLHEGAAGFIQKPFKLFELSNMISETLRT